MHIEVQVALNFVISYLYNKLPRRRVNLFGEELEKALKDKFQGHWYPEKPFKGSAFRCLKTGDPIDAVLDRAARESGVPITDILEYLPSELAVWVDPGEVSYRIGEKGAVKILFSENNDHLEDSSADREVTKTFNPEAQCFRPIDSVSSSLSGLSLSPKISPQVSPPISSLSPGYKRNLPASPTPGTGAFLPRTQAPLTFTTATFAQTKFGSTKLKTNSKRANSSYRMSPTEFSNYIKQKAMQQQLHHPHGSVNNHFGPICPTSPSRSLSPNPLALSLQNDAFYFTSINMGMYPSFGAAPRNMYDTHTFHPVDPATTTAAASGGLYTPNAAAPNKYSSYIEQPGFYGTAGGINNPNQQQQSVQPNCGMQQQLASTPVTINNLVNIAAGNNATANNSNNNNNNSNSNDNNNMKSNLLHTANSNNNNNCNSSSNVSGNQNSGMNNSNTASILNGGITGPTEGAIAASTTVNQVVTPIASPRPNPADSNAKLIDGLNSFYSSTPGPYQHLLVAN